MAFAPVSNSSAVLRRQKARAFTLIEMLVVVGVMALITSLVLANNSRFGGVILLQNLAYDIALSIRQAQVYGIAVQRFNTTYSAAYGMHFQVDSGAGSTYVLFADALAPANGYYDCPQPGTTNCELVQSTSIASGYRVSQLCVTLDEVERCDATSLDITFMRPEPDAYIRSSLGAGLYEAGEIHVQSPRGDTKVITIQANGQIAVE